MVSLNPDDFENIEYLSDCDRAESSCSSLEDDKIVHEEDLKKARMSVKQLRIVWEESKELEKKNKLQKKVRKKSFLAIDTFDTKNSNYTNELV